MMMWNNKLYLCKKNVVYWACARTSENAVVNEKNLMREENTFIDNIWKLSQKIACNTKMCWWFMPVVGRG